jgi:transcriptional regulator with XRE-family HTH domain
MRNKIRQFRKQRGLTLAGLGAAIGLTPQSVSRIETGKMRLSTGWMEQIAAALNVSPADLLDATSPGGSELIGEAGDDGFCQSVPPQPFRFALPGPDSRVVRVAQPCGPYRAGEYLVCVRLPRARHEEALGRDCLVEPSPRIRAGAKHLHFRGSRREAGCGRISAPPG